MIDFILISTNVMNRLKDENGNIAWFWFCHDDKKGL